MENMDIRRAISDSGLRYWQIANAIGVNDGNFSRKLRKELSEEVKIKIFAAITTLSAERNTPEGRTE